jgi:hypothetical protein
MSVRQMRLVIWLNGAAAAGNWIVFAKTLDWWQLLTAILLTFSAVVWAVRLKRAAAT